MAVGLLEHHEPDQRAFVRGLPTAEGRSRAQHPLGVDRPHRGLAWRVLLFRSRLCATPEAGRFEPDLQLRSATASAHPRCLGISSLLARSAVQPLDATTTARTGLYLA